MSENKKYVVESMKLHLFFARIMKEHCILMIAGFTPKNTKLSKETGYYKVEFEKLLFETVKLSGGIIEEGVLASGEFFTDYTLGIEEQTQYFTGININKKITIMELQLCNKENREIDNTIIKATKELNKKAIKLVDDLIDLKERVLNDVLCCKIFTGNYPLLLEQLVRESKEYRQQIEDIIDGKLEGNIDIKDTELFWDRVMMEHALFIRGLLDSTESELIEVADKFAKVYEKLLKKGEYITKSSLDEFTTETLEETFKLRDFKEAGAKGRTTCESKSIILPIVADHVLREANHYIRLLKSYNNLK